MTTQRSVLCEGVGAFCCRLIEYCSRSGTATCFPAESLLFDRPLAASLAEARLDTICFSIDDFGGTADAVRRKRVAFVKVRRVLENVLTGRGGANDRRSRYARPYSILQAVEIKGPEDGVAVLSSEKIDLLYNEVRRGGWTKGFSLLASSLPFDEVLLLDNVVNGGFVGWKLLLDLSGIRRALIVETLLGNITESFALHCGEVHTLHFDQRILECVVERLKEKKIENVTHGRLDGGKDLPFVDNSFDLIVVHDMGVVFQYLDGGAAHKEKLKWFLGETRRLLAESGTLYLSFGNRLGLYNLFHRTRRGSGVATPGSERELFSMYEVKRVLRESGLNSFKFYAANPSIEEMRQIRRLCSPMDFSWREKGGSRGVKAAIKDYFKSSGICAQAFVVTASTSGGAGFLEQIIDYSGLGEKGCKIKDFKLGNVPIAILESDENKVRDGGFVVRLPLDKERIGLCKRNADTLSLLAEMKWEGVGISRPWKKTYNGLTFFVEDKIAGVSARDNLGASFADCFTNIADYLIDMHLRTARRATLTADSFVRLFEPYKSFLESNLDKADGGRLGSFERFVRTRLVGAELPKVLQHGDLSLENVLVDPETASVNGIIDWEFSEHEGLPFIDCLQLIASKRRVQQRKTLGDIFATVILPLRFDALEKNFVERYVEALGIDRNLLAPLAIISWLHHIVRKVRFQFLWSHPEWKENGIAGPFRVVRSLYL